MSSWERMGLGRTIPKGDMRIKVLKGKGKKKRRKKEGKNIKKKKRKYVFSVEHKWSCS